MKPEKHYHVRGRTRVNLIINQALVMINISTWLIASMVSGSHVTAGWEYGVTLGIAALTMAYLLWGMRRTFYLGRTVIDVEVNLSPHSDGGGGDSGDTGGGSLV